MRSLMLVMLIALCGIVAYFSYATASQNGCNLIDPNVRDCDSTQIRTPRDADSTAL